MLQYPRSQKKNQHAVKNTETLVSEEASEECYMIRDQINSARNL